MKIILGNNIHLLLLFVFLMKHPRLRWRSFVFPCGVAVSVTSLVCKMQMTHNHGLPCEDFTLLTQCNQEPDRQTADVLSLSTFQEPIDKMVRMDAGGGRGGDSTLGTPMQGAGRFNGSTVHSNEVCTGEIPGRWGPWRMSEKVVTLGAPGLGSGPHMDTPQ
uniref:Uncharacterized protein n=1 Tax=Sphaerodactylus townsendi TaxID=933632 RepID=A0ACB8FSW4_9SAUR